MESVADGMESRPKTEEYKLSLDAIRGRAAMPYNAHGVDSIPSPSVLDKNNRNRKFDFGYFLVGIGAVLLLPRLAALITPKGVHGIRNLLRYGIITE